MAFATADLNHFTIEVGNFNGQALSQEVTMAELAELSTSPSIDVTIQTEGNRVTFATLDVDDVDVFQL